MQLKNKCISAVAGSGKTRAIVDECYNNPNCKILLTTYTDNNADALKEKIIEKFGTVPSRITIRPWFSFLLENWVRPYVVEFFTFPIGAHIGLHFVNERSMIYCKRGSKQYFFDDNNDIYSDKLSDFGAYCDEKTDKKCIKRLEEIYDIVCIDEIQDISGHDLDILTSLFKSSIRVLVVGDQQQRIFKTNPSTYHQKQCENIIEWIKTEFSSSVELCYMNYCYRCSFPICQYVKELFSECQITSKNNNKSEHIGIFKIKKEELDNYVQTFNPLILGFNKKSNHGFDKYMNYGESKGLEEDHVLIIPTKDIRNYITNGKEIDSLSTKRKFYVAITRARYSVAFLID